MISFHLLNVLSSRKQFFDFYDQHSWKRNDNAGKEFHRCKRTGVKKCIEERNVYNDKLQGNGSQDTKEKKFIVE